LPRPTRDGETENYAHCVHCVMYTTLKDEINTLILRVSIFTERRWHVAVQRVAILFVIRQYCVIDSADKG